MSIVIAITIIICGSIYAKYDYDHDSSQWLRGINGWVVMILSVAVAVGIIIGSYLG